MKMLTIPVSTFWVICRADEDFTEEFGASQFEEADDYLQKMRHDYPDHHFEMLATVSA